MSGVTSKTRAIELCVLGPLEVRAGDAVLPLGTRKQQTALALLTVQAGRVVALEELIDELWPDSPPASAVANVRSYAASLRRLFDALDDQRGRLVRRGSGYQLDADPDEVDLLAFSSRCARGRQALRSGETEAAATDFRDALGYWRGPMLAGLPTGPRLTARSATAEGERLSITEELADVYLALAQPAEVVRLLHSHVQMHRLRERAYELLMRALYQLGDVAGALSVYADARNALVDQLGIEPGRELQELQRSILGRAVGRDHPTRTAAVLLDPVGSAERPLTSPSHQRPPESEAHGQTTDGDRVTASYSPSPAPPMPAELPADLVDFVGRVAETERAIALLQGSGPHTVPICAVVGQPGVGKTSLAVHVAHRLRERYVDGQLFVDLRGADSHPLAPGEVLARFLRSLGLAGHAIPHDIQERAALYRSLLAGRRLLVVLDNAADEEQVRPLLPGSATCGVLITSRHRLAGLVGSTPINLDVLATDNALSLLDRTAGETRVRAEPDAARELVRLCGNLPLALRVVGVKLAMSPHRALSALVDRLTEERHRLDQLAHAGLAVRASLDFSYQRLIADDQILLRRVALLDAPDFAAWTASAVADQPLAHVEDALDRLIAASLVQVTGSDMVGQVRYHMHDLVRVYAREKAAAEESEQDRRAAIRRTLHRWLSIVASGEETLFGQGYLVRIGRELGSAVLDAPTPRQVVVAPFAWVEAECAALIATVQQAADMGLLAECWRLACVSVRMLEGRELLDETLTVHRVALVAARRLGDRRGEAVALTSLGRLDVELGRWAQGRSTLEFAESIFLEEGDEEGLAHCYRVLAYLDRYEGRLSSAQDRYAAMARICHDVDPGTEAFALRGLGQVHLFAGRPEQAVASLEAALEICRHNAGVVPRFFTLYWYGRACLELGDTARARSVFQDVVSWSRQAGEPDGEALNLACLAQVALQEGDLGAAERYASRAYDLYHPVLDTSHRITIREALARVRLAQGAVATARQLAEEMLDDCRSIGSIFYLARTLEMLADIHDAAGDADAAAAARAEASLRRSTQPA